METIQLAQMLADLSDLNAAEPEAAAALVNVNKTVTHQSANGTTTTTTSTTSMTTTTTARVTPKTHENRHHQRVASASAAVNRTASPAKFDNFGRRLLSPPLTRTNSAQGSIPGTPRRGDSEPDSDVDRASAFMALYEIRAKLKQQDNTSLMRAREQVAAMAAKQQQQQQTASMERRDHMDARHSRYTFPRAS